MSATTDITHSIRADATPGRYASPGVGDNGGMPRAIWSGSISFGLVNVPVKLYSAISPKDVRFNQLEEGTGARIRQKRVSAETGEEVPYERIVKGYEISPDRYVIITPEELEALDPKANRSIDIEDFVEYDQIDPVHYERPYYLVPEKGAAKAYALLLQAMKDSNKVAIARMVLRTKQYLAAIRPKGDVLCLETMLFADEVVPESELDGVPGDDVEVSERELKMARQLIESLSTDFEPEKYQDEYRQKVLALIEAKAEGQEIVAPPASEEPAQVVDLMAALEASLAAARANKEKEGSG
jgi:DNA end-binding protein Ku